MSDVTEEDFQRRLRAIRRLIARWQLPKPTDDQANSKRPAGTRSAGARSQAEADKPAS